MTFSSRFIGAVLITISVIWVGQTLTSIHQPSQPIERGQK